MYPDRRRKPPTERSIQGLKEATTPKSHAVPRAVIAEFDPAIEAVLEHLLAQEGYAIEVQERASLAISGTALMLVAAGDGLYVFESHDAAGALQALDPGAKSSLEIFSGVKGIQAFVPKPFGAGDVLRVVRAVRGFDGRRRSSRGGRDLRT